MMAMKWLWRLLTDVMLAGFVNRSLFLSISVLSLIVLGLVFAAAQVSAPFIYTLF